MPRYQSMTDRRTLLKAACLGFMGGLYQPWQQAWGAQPAPQGEAALAARSNNNFALDLLKQLDDTPSNAVVSPASIAIALAMTATGAKGATRREMLQVLHASEREEAWLVAMGQLSTQLTGASDGFALTMANRLWGQTGYDFKAEFLTRLERDFAAPAGQLDFASSPDASRQRINKWVSDQTNNRINDLLAPGIITSLTRLVLANAVYFKADWQRPFDPKSTRKQPFFCSDGQQVDVPLMRQRSGMAYTDNDDVQVVELPYRGGQMSMLLVVPRAKDGLAAVEQNLSTATLDGWLAGLRREEVDLQLPKFKIEQKLALKPMLSAMGMPRAFSQAAEFGGISASDELELTEVVHQAFMEVDEKGTEAAAATAAVVGVRSAIGPAPAEPKFVRADHPFWLAIRHQPSGALVFAGRCTRPAK